MKRHWPIVGLSVLALAAIDAAHAGAKHRKHARHVVAYPSASVAPPSSFEPARMYEARPGVWISTYDCITDDGYGRWRPCGSGGSKAGKTSRDSGAPARGLSNGPVNSPSPQRGAPQRLCPLPACSTACNAI